MSRCDFPERWRNLELGINPNYRRWCPCSADPAPFFTLSVMGNPLLGDPTSLPGRCIPGMWLQVLKSWKRGAFLLHPSTELPWLGPALPWRALLSRESFWAVQNHFPQILICSFTAGRSWKTHMGTMCLFEGKHGESRENPGEREFWQPGKQLHRAFGMCSLQLRGWKASGAQWRGHSTGNHLPALSSKP